MAKDDRDNGDNAYQEREIKLDAPDADTMRAVQSFVLSNPEIFTPSTFSTVLTGMPADLVSSFRPPLEITDIRTRIYYDTADLTGFHNGIEIRQERKSKGSVKQTVKIGGNATSADPMLDRNEYPAFLDDFGVDVGAVKSGRVRASLKDVFGRARFHPLVCMLSQRTRIKYHPQGDADVLIELGFDMPCRGYTASGFSWDAPQLELEIVKGPDDHAQARAVLEREAARFGRFGLVRNITSKPAPGFERLAQELAGKEGREVIKAIDARGQWWLALPAGPMETVKKPVAPKLAKS